MLKEKLQKCLDEAYEEFERQLTTNAEQIRKAQNEISALRVAIDRAGFELKEIEGGYILCRQ